jgi:exosortase/archaeosortase family protein
MQAQHSMLPMVIFQKIKQWAQSPSGMEIWRSLFVGSISLAAVVFMFAIHVLAGEWTWVQKFGRHFSSQLTVEFFPVPLAFILWFRLVEQDKKFTFSFSPFYLLLSIFCFVEARETVWNYDFELQKEIYTNLQQDFFGIGVIAALFIFVPVEEVLLRMAQTPRKSLCALVAGSAACNYYWFMHTLWEQMCTWTSRSALAVLQFLQMNATSNIYTPWKSSVMIASPYFTIFVNAACNGLEGILLFNFLLSILMLHDWDSFKRKSILFLYAVGIIYIFCVNVLRIVSFFSLGYWANHPDAWGWVQSLKGAPVYLFHSYVGWVYYFIAFELFAAWLYRNKRVIS